MVMRDSERFWYVEMSTLKVGYDMGYCIRGEERASNCILTGAYV